MPTRRSILAAPLAAAAQSTPATPTPFPGQPSAWHEGFPRYDYILDDSTGAITPIPTPPKEIESKNADRTVTDGRRRVVIVTPRTPAPGLPWSWRGCYWNHEPQTEIELLRRGFHICYVAPDRMHPGPGWDRLYNFLTTQHGLSPKPAFIGMSQGGANEFHWTVRNPTKVSCIYADNPGIHAEDLAKIPDLAQHQVPLLLICGSEDALLEHHALAAEKLYHQHGGAVTTIIKEGQAHHPHSLRNPKFIADWIESQTKREAPQRPAFLDANYTTSSWYPLTNSFSHFPEENTYATCRGPGFVEAYTRLDQSTRFPYKLTGHAIVAPRQPAPGLPWLFQADNPNRDSTLDFALLAHGYHVVYAPNTKLDGMVQQHWDDTYSLLIAKGFSPKPLLAASHARAGEAYAWAIANPQKVSRLYLRNPLLRSLMTKEPILENLRPLAEAKVPILHHCTANHPWLESQSRAAERVYHSLQGHLGVLVEEQSLSLMPALSFLLDSR